MLTTREHIGTTSPPPPVRRKSVRAPDQIYRQSNINPVSPSAMNKAHVSRPGETVRPRPKMTRNVPTPMARASHSTRRPLCP